MKKKMCLVIVLVTIFLIGVVLFIYKNEESDNIFLPTEGTEEIIVHDAPIEEHSPHTYTPYSRQDEEQ